MTPEAIETADARCAIHRDVASWDGLKTASLGGFRCASAEAGARLLVEACRRLAGEGFAAVVGPMDGDTWHAYRLVVESDGRPPFALEPVNARHDPEAFARAGFVRVADYVSAIDTTVARPGRPAPDRLADVAVRSWRPADAIRELGRIHELSLRMFAGNAFYRPISFEDFRALYDPILPVLDPAFVLLAEDAAGLAGFLFAVPDRASGALVLKTYASRRLGVGALLIDRVYEAARGRGVGAVIHALMHVDNPSYGRSRRLNGAVFRRYALFGRRFVP